MSEQQARDIAQPHEAKPVMTVVPPSAEAQPVAVALPVKDIASLSGSITADASASTGGRLAYFWQCVAQPQGSKPDIVSPYTARTLITRLSPGHYVFQVVVSNSQGFHMSKLSLDVFAPVPETVPEPQPEQAIAAEEPKEIAPEPAEEATPAQPEATAGAPAVLPPPMPTRHAPEQVALSSPTIPALSMPVSPYRSIAAGSEESPVISSAQPAAEAHSANRSIYIWAGLAAAGLAVLIYKASRLRQGGGIK